MTTEQTAQQLRLAADIIETGHPFEVRHDASDRWHASLGVNPAQAVLQNWHLRPVLATPPDNRPLHNPDNLTAEAVGVGYRLLLREELQNGEAHPELQWLATAEPLRRSPGFPWFPGGSSVLNSCRVRNKEYDRDVWETFRLPLSVPWPEPADPYAEPQTKTVPLGPEDVPPGSVFRGAGEAKDPDNKDWCLITSCSRTGIRYWRQSDSDPEPISWLTLKTHGAQINRSLSKGQWNPDAWEPCHKKYDC